MTRYGLLIEANRCIGCWVCVTACKDEFVGNDFPPYSAAQSGTSYGFYPGAVWTTSGATGSTWVQHGQKWITDGEFVLGKMPNIKTKFFPQPCMHCDSAPCQKAATGGAVYTRPDGIVIIDPAKSAGQTQLVSSCPYGRIYWNSNTNIAQKCTMCAHLVDQGQNPKCVDACPVNAIIFGDLDNPSSTISALVSRLDAQPYHPEYDTKPKVYYSGLPAPFVSGKVVNGNTGAYVEGATVTLTPTDGSSPSRTATTDNYADFEFDGLTVGKMYMVQATATGMMTEETLVFLDQAKDIGKIRLFP